MDAARGLFCNRTLNLRSIRAIGYDMDYTLIHYHSDEWEQRVYDYLQQHFRQIGWPVEGLRFDPRMVSRGLVIDTERGNILKANRFGFVKRSMHGTKPLEFEAQRQTYSRTVVDVAENRWIFLNTFFSLSEACMYAQLVDLLDQKRIPEVLGYKDLYERVRLALDATHMEGRMKAEILSDPERYVVLEPETPLALYDQHMAGKQLMLITNSEWNYTEKMMTYAFDRFLPDGMKWRDLFDLVIVSARKPQFFTTRSPLFEVATQEGLLKPLVGGALTKGTVYLGGSVHEVEKHFRLSGDEILYVGDHMFGDVHVTKNVLRWRTALILRELEEEFRAAASFQASEQELIRLMDEKERLQGQVDQLKLAIQRRKHGYGPQPLESEEELQNLSAILRQKLEELDHKITPLARASVELNNPSWGLLMRAGNDKSLLAFQVERYADIYTSRVSNFLNITPFAYLRSHRGVLPHEVAYGPDASASEATTESKKERPLDGLV